ncbi:hypothetical protein [Sphingomonas sp. UNC305MFCol5.2]|uniref:hypothetical protein n=1 Tax=Sphingomonas sp. UNC305MFCol5.2 TaxID=1449076 RepID=UPI00041AD086|nr:hypothetical protein [Sphingomonas sp. UNC305MFCol5.2]
MLPLDNPRWSELRHAYGSASDIPPLLHQLRSSTAPGSDYRDEPWFSLWSSLCHQGQVYSASYAAVPHIVQIALETTTPIHFSFLQLPASIEVARCTEHGPEIAAELADAHFRAIANLVEIVALQRHHPWDQEMLLCAAAAQAVAKGHIPVAEALLNLDEGWIAKINEGAFD